MRKRVLFVWPSSQPEHMGWPPLGISYVASYLAHHEPEVSIKIVDYGVVQFSPEAWRRELALFEPDIVGVSVLMLNATEGVQLARLAKEANPGIITVFGGVYASLFPHELVKSCDIVVRGEGEETFHEICQGRDLDTIKGISYARDSEVLDTPPGIALRTWTVSPFRLSLYLTWKAISGMVCGLGPSWDQEGVLTGVPSAPRNISGVVP